MVATKERKKVRTVFPEEHRKRVHILCENLESVLQTASYFDLTAEGNFLQIRVENFSGQELLEEISV